MHMHMRMPARPESAGSAPAHAGVADSNGDSPDAQQ